MPRWRLENKLNPAARAWRSFATKVRPKIQKLLKNSVPNALKSAAKRLVISFNRFFPSKLRSISNPNNFNYQKNHHMSQLYAQKTCHKSFSAQQSQYAQRTCHKSFSAVHIDELFEPSNPGTSRFRENNDINNYKGKKMVNFDHDDKSKSTLYSVDEAWRAVVAASPQLRSVDERAEEFIIKMRRDIKLQKDKSDLEFQEMLARGA